MIKWLEREEGTGIFDSAFFMNEDGNQLLIYAFTDKDGYVQMAEQVVAAFNSLPMDTIRKICEGLIVSAKEDGDDSDFELGDLERPEDILNYCWFVAVYVDMNSPSDNPAFAVEGEGEWGENIGFVVDNGEVIYVGTDYLQHMKYAC